MATVYFHRGWETEDIRGLKSDWRCKVLCWPISRRNVPLMMNFVLNTRFSLSNMSRWTIFHREQYYSQVLMEILAHCPTAANGRTHSWNISINHHLFLHFLLSFSTLVQWVFVKVLVLRLSWAAFVPQNFSITVNQWPTKPLTWTISSLFVADKGLVSLSQPYPRQVGRIYSLKGFSYFRNWKPRISCWKVAAEKAAELQYIECVNARVETDAVPSGAVRQVIALRFHSAQMKSFLWFGWPWHRGPLALKITQ